MKKPKPKPVRKPAVRRAAIKPKPPKTTARPVAPPELPIVVLEVPVDHPAFLKASHGHRMARAGWVGKTITGNGAGGFVFADGSPYQPTAEDLAATDWSVK